MYHLYIVRCVDRTLYTGIAKDLKKRLAEHNTTDRGAKYTRSRRPVRLVYSRAFRSRSKALKAEAQTKQLSRFEKLALIRKSK